MEIYKFLSFLKLFFINYKLRNLSGWWANITHMGDIREKMLNYLNVMSRPINFNVANKKNTSFIWSYLHVDLADRRLSNWLWKKFEGIRQRKVFLDHIKRIVNREKQWFEYSSHMLLKTTHVSNIKPLLGWCIFSRLSLFPETQISKFYWSIWKYFSNVLSRNLKREENSPCMQYLNSEKVWIRLQLFF